MWKLCSHSRSGHTYPSRVVFPGDPRQPRFHLALNCGTCVPFQAGATSMWASCCGLLNEVMGTGAVRGQQSGFAGGTGPFRFTPNSDFSTYPPATPEGPNIVCKACGLSFSVFRKKVSWVNCYIRDVRWELLVIVYFEKIMNFLSYKNMKNWSHWHFFPFREVCSQRDYIPVVCSA